MKNKYKFLYFIVCLVLCLPFLQSVFPFIKEKALKGSIVKTTKLPLKGNWLNSKYQNTSEKYFEENLGLRSYFIRSYNQFYFTLYNQPKANQVVVGRDNYLYEENYIKAYLGLDFIGEEKIIEKVVKLKAIQDTLASKNIHLAVLFAPGKASFYPNYIPETYPQKKDSTNLQSYIDACNKYNVNYINLNKWFVEMKDTSPYVLFPKCGVHWSQYGEVLVVDSLTNYINSIDGHYCGNIIIDTIKVSTKMKGTDQDAEDGMNLLFNISDLEMPYPEFHIEHSDEHSDVVTFVSDSYYWGIFNYGISRDLFNKGKFWYYNQQIYPDHFTTESLVQNLPSITSEIEKNNTIFLLSTDANLYKFAYGWIDLVYNAYFDKNQELLDKYIAEYILAIKNTPDWYAAMEKSSVEKNISLEQTIYDNAKYMAEIKMAELN